MSTNDGKSPQITSSPTTKSNMKNSFPGDVSKLVVGLVHASPKTESNKLGQKFNSNSQVANQPVVPTSSPSSGNH